jgi:ABC-type cobalamin/Fe3+-siderophores transport system ATPase subunit
MAGLLPVMSDRYLLEFSGGQRQRIGIAGTVAPEPSLIVGGDPLSVRDISIQAQIVNLFIDLRERPGLFCIFIVRDLAVTRHISYRIGSWTWDGSWGSPGATNYTVTRCIPTPWRCCPRFRIRKRRRRGLDRSLRVKSPAH